MLKAMHAAAMVAGWRGVNPGVTTVRGVAASTRSIVWGDPKRAKRKLHAKNAPKGV